MKLSNKKLEELENEYLEQYYYFLKFSMKAILKGLASKEKIKNDWFDIWNSGKDDSDTKQGFSVGAERVIYYYLSNSKILGDPNSCPVSSDLMFEVDDAYIHIDLKTVQTSNIGDIKNKIFIGNNQNSYRSPIDVSGNELNYKNANLPCYYNSEKPCLTYFITILHDQDSLDNLMISIMCMPNGQLKDVYGKDVLSAGKTVDPKERKKGNVSSVRFNFSSVQEFKLLDAKRRIKVAHLHEDIIDGNIYQDELKVFIDNYKKDNM